MFVGVVVPAATTADVVVVVNEICQCWKKG